MSQFKFDPNSTKNEGRYRLVDPQKFTGSMWSKKDRECEGIRFIYGNLNRGGVAMQTIRFDKNIWDEKKAGEWWEKNKKRFYKEWTPADWENWTPKPRKKKTDLVSREVADVLAEMIVKDLSLEYVKDVGIDYPFKKDIGFLVGSYRRGEKKVGDLDIILTRETTKAEVEKNLDVYDLTGGEKRIDFRYRYLYREKKCSIQVNLFIFLDKKTWGAALLHATGPRNYNTRIRKRFSSDKWINRLGKGEGWSLSQNGLKKFEKIFDTPTERSLLKTIGVTEREPTDRG